MYHQSPRGATRKKRLDALILEKVLDSVRSFHISQPAAHNRHPRNTELNS